MSDFWSILASLIEAIANWGAGTASTGIGYEPEIPSGLRK